MMRPHCHSEHGPVAADDYKLTPSEIAQVLGASAEYKVSEVADRNAGIRIEDQQTTPAFLSASGEVIRATDSGTVLGVQALAFAQSSRRINSSIRHLFEQLRRPRYRASERWIGLHRRLATPDRRCNVGLAFTQPEPCRRLARSNFECLQRGYQHHCTWRLVHPRDLGIRTAIHQSGTQPRCGSARSTRRRPS